MSASLHSLARRSVDAIHARLVETPTEQITVRIPPFKAAVFMFTLIAFFCLIFAISYTYGHLLPTLCMIESPETNAYVPVETISSPDEPPAYTEDEDGMPKASADADVLLIRTKPYTSSIRETLLHLRARGGCWSRFRGLGLFIIWAFLRNFIIGIFSLGSRNPLIVSLAAILAEVGLAHIHMTWVHVVISEPSPLRWYKRIPSLRSNWVKIAPAVLLWSVVTQIVHVLPMLICASWGALKQMRDPDFQPGNKHIYISATQLFMAFLLTVAMFIMLEIPATVTMVRVAASMLPEEDETIVPFDRSYGGKVTPTIIGGQGKIGLVEAWRSFPWQSRKRLLMMCAKVAAFIIAIWVGLSMVVIAEAQWMIGPEALKEIMKTFHGGK